MNEQTPSATTVKRCIEGGQIRLILANPGLDGQVQSRLFDFENKAAIAGWLEGKVAEHIDIHASAAFLCQRGLPNQEDWPLSVLDEAQLMPATAGAEQ